MSNLKSKSEIYLESAKLLNTKNLYPPVAHCSYYACYQLFKHLWLYEFKRSENDLTALCNSSPREGSHEVLINQIVKYMKSSTLENKEDNARVLNNKIGQLKKLRVQADYQDLGFDSTSSSNAINLSHDIISILGKLTGINK